LTGYTDTIRKWATDTRRAGTLPHADGTGEVGLDSADAGSRIAARFTLKINLNRITDIRYQVFGCGFSMAACAIAADMSIGYSLDDMKNINADAIIEALDGLPEDRFYCADLAAEALQAAVASVLKNHKPVLATLKAKDDHGARVNASDPVYGALTSGPLPPGVESADRHMFACLLAAASQESHPVTASLGLSDSDVDTIFETFFPESGKEILKRSRSSVQAAIPEINEEVLTLLLRHVSEPTEESSIPISTYLCHILAARASQPGHLWVSMGFFERPELTASIRRHLPSLADANNKNMRWKRYLFREVCNLNGGTMCKAPNCGVCSDYALCFAPEE